MSFRARPSLGETWPFQNSMKPKSKVDIFVLCTSILIFMAVLEYIREAARLQSHSSSHITTKVSTCIERCSAYFLGLCPAVYYLLTTFFTLYFGLIFTPILQPPPPSKTFPYNPQSLRPHIQQNGRTKLWRPRSDLQECQSAPSSMFDYHHRDDSELHFHDGF